MKRGASAISNIVEGHIFTDGPIEKDYASKIEAQIAQLPPNVNKLIHHIRSGGGHVYGGYEGYIALQKTKLPIKSIVEGQAQSMATFLALAGNETEMVDPGTWMFHDPYFPDGVPGNSDDLMKASTELAQISETMAKRYAEKTGKPIDEIKALMKKETRMTPSQAKQFGFIDNVITANGGILASAEANDFFTKLENTIMKLFGRNAAVANGPTAKDYALKEGGMLSVAGDTLVQGAQATMNGQPAEGTYTLADGTSVSCAGGVITTVTQAQMQQQNIQQQNTQQQLATQLKAAQDELAAIKAKDVERAKAEELVKLAEAEKVKLAEAEKLVAANKATQEALAKAQEENEALKKAAAGNQNAAPVAMSHLTFPNSFRGAPQAAALEATKGFLWENGFSYLADNPNSPMYGYKHNVAVAASALETNFSYTWPGQLTTEIFYKPQLLAPALADLFVIDQGIKDRKRYNLVDRLDKILKPYGGCARSFTGSVTITDMLLQTKEFNVGLEWCKDDFTDQLTGVYNNLASEWLKTGNRSFDPTGTPIFTVLDRLISEALARDVFRRVSFAAGNSSDDDYNQIDGLWDRLIDSSGGPSNYCVIRANAAVNGGVGLGTSDLAAGIALTNLELVYRKSAQVLKNMPGKVFWVTRSIWENLYNSYIASGTVAGNTEAQFKNLVAGLDTLTYKGIPVKPVDLWDAFLAESDNPLVLVTRHLILLTVKENHILGVENGSDLNKVEGWYERKDRKYYFEGDMKFGYNYLHCDLSTIAY